MTDLTFAVRYFPDWMPGSYSKCMALTYKKSFDKYTHRPHNFTKEQMVE